MTPVAERVETPAEWDLVVELGGDAIQGYFLGRPRPKDEFFSWLQLYRPEAPPS